MTFKVLEAQENENWLILPPKPADEVFVEMGEERLAAVICSCFTASGCALIPSCYSS